MVKEIEKILGPKTTEYLKRIRSGLELEGRQTKDMFKTYFRYTKGQASEEEMEEANKQFLDFLKTLGLGVFVVLPMAPITIPAIVKLGKKIGIDIIPDSFREQEKKT